MGQTFSNNDKKYDVDKLIELSKTLPVHEIEMSKLLFNLQGNCWSDEINDPERKLPNFSPEDVILHHDKEDKYRYHYEKMQRSDLSYPILLDKDLLVADGIHRLLKAHVQGESKIKAVIFNEFPQEALLN